jgi:acyl-CoA dehydrogenase
VLAKTGEENGRPLMATFLVEKGTPGFSVTPQIHKLGIRAEDTAGLLLEDVRIPEENRVAGDLRETLRVFNKSRPLVSACALGVCRAMLDFTTDKLRAAGHEIDFRAGNGHQSAVAERLLRLEALYEATWHLVVHSKWLEDVNGPLRTEASMAKAKGGRAARTITQECIALLGPSALSEAELAEKWFRDARIFDIYEGPGEIQRLIIARQLLGYRRDELR